MYYYLFIIIILLHFVLFLLHFMLFYHIKKEIRQSFSGPLFVIFLFLIEFSKVLSGLWECDGGETTVNPGKFYRVFKESVPYFSGYRYVQYKL